MTRDELDREMAAVLLQLETCSHVPAATRSGSSSSDEPLGGRCPPGDHGAHVYARLYGAPFSEEPRLGGYTRERGEIGALERILHLGPYPRTDDDREKVINAARDELKDLRGHGQATRPRPVGETLEDRNKRIVKEGEGFPAGEVAVRFRCGIRDVYKARLTAKEPREPEYGRLPQATADVEARRARARQLADSGHTLAQITRILGVSRSTIERDLGRAGRT